MIKNATIEGARIEIEDHGLLTAWLDLDYGDSGHQGFGGYCLDNAGCAKFLRRCMEVVGVYQWDALRGKTIRVEAGNDRIERIGNITKNQWFNPREDLK